MRRALAIAVMLAACGGDSSSGDAGATIDAFDRPDAGPSCGVTWDLVPATVTGLTLIDPSPLNTARTTRVLVTVEANACDERAMFTVTPGSAEVVIDARVWRPLGIDCPPSTQIFERPVSLLLDAPVEWTIRAGTATPLMLEVGPAPLRPCMTGGGQGSCALDCDCAAGEACLGGNGFAGPFTGCAKPCELDRDCGGEGSCISATDGLAYYCDNGIVECDASKACPTGYSCSAGSCTLDPILGAATRKACTCDDDCDAPLRCVESSQPGRTRHCEVTCQTDGAWCNGAHYCATAAMDVAGTAPADSVCIWAGE